MSRKSKMEPEEKVKIVERYLEGEISQKVAARICNMNKRSIQDWIRIYRMEGPAGLQEQTKNKYYSKERKLQAVNDYLSAKGSLDELCITYGIRQHSQLIQWIRVYHSGKELKEPTGGTSMKKARETTQEERLRIVEECLESGRNLGARAIKYRCSYQQIRSLEDRRGRRAGSQPSRTAEETLRDKIAELERKNKNLEMENDLLKKVRELERGNRFL